MERFNYKNCNTCIFIAVFNYLIYCIRGQAIIIIVYSILVARLPLYYTGFDPQPYLVGIL